MALDVKTAAEKLIEITENNLQVVNKVAKLNEEKSTAGGTTMFQQAGSQVAEKKAIAGRAIEALTKVNEVAHQVHAAAQNERTAGITPGLSSGSSSHNNGDN